MSVCSNESDLLDEIERGDIELGLQENLERSEHQIGDWLLIKYYIGKSKKTVHYVGMIHEINHQIYEMRFLKFKIENKNSTSFIYPNNDDMDEIDENNIICRHYQNPVLEEEVKWSLQYHLLNIIWLSKNVLYHGYLNFSFSICLINC